MTGRDDPLADLPTWDDEYLDRVSDRLMHNYDLDKDFEAGGERFDLYGRMRIDSQKQLFHPSLNYANHHAEEHLFARRVEDVSPANVDRLTELGHDLAASWIDASEEHYGTDFTFALVAPRIPDDVRDLVGRFRDRTLLKFGYHGHYEVNLVVVAPDDEDAIASRNADVVDAFTLWTPVRPPRPGFLTRVARRLGR
jgi:hypothetical protein